MDTEMYAKTLGKRLRAARNEFEMSLTDVEVASKGAWRSGAIGSYERGQRNITVAQLAQLADFYGVPITDLLPQKEECPLYG